jgi:hypothetical protein
MDEETPMSRTLQFTTASLALLFVAAFGLTAGARAQEANTPAGNAAIIKAMDNAMEPGEGQKRLEFLIGTFDVKVKVWLEPNQPPIESQATAVATWVLGHRYVQQMLSGFIMGEAWAGIGYAGYDNIAKTYVACYMDSGSTGMEWYKGQIDPDGRLAKMTATIYDAMTLKPVELEMRLAIDPDGDHVTELWQPDGSGHMFKALELKYTRKKS